MQDCAAGLLCGKSLGKLYCTNCKQLWHGICFSRDKVTDNDWYTVEVSYELHESKLIAMLLYPLPQQFVRFIWSDPDGLTLPHWMHYFFEVPVGHGPAKHKSHKIIDLRVYEHPSIVYDPDNSCQTFSI
jgi:hypothetical protein